jgi:MFS family permease
VGGGRGTAAALRRRTGRIGAPFTATRDALADPALRRLQLGWAGSTTGEYVSVVAFGVVAYEAGGAAAVGLVGVVQMLPAALLNPVVALLGDRYRRERVVVVSDLLRAATMLGAAGAVAVDAPVVVLYVLAAALAVAGVRCTRRRWRWSRCSRAPPVT